jgi:hypothetical protein
MQKRPGEPQASHIDLFFRMLRTASPDKAHAVQNINLTVPLSVFSHTVAASYAEKPLMLPGQAKGLVVVCHEWPCLSIQERREPMQNLSGIVKGRYRRETTGANSKPQLYCEAQ